MAPKLFHFLLQVDCRIGSLEMMDKLEQMDVDTLNEFGAWLEAEGLQAIATRVSTGDECSIIIEDGYVAGEKAIPATEETPVTKTWKAGEF